jgi:unsaturated rhamnogalacturonyl hydrolase
MPSCELIVILPAGESREHALHFVGRCILYGLDLYFEDSDTLPSALPCGVDGVKAIVYEDTTEVDPLLLAAYEAAGARSYRLKSQFDMSRPTERRYWEMGHLQDMLTMDANLTLQHPGFRARMQARSDGFLFDSLIANLVTHVETRWCEPARHQWEGMLDAYELTGDVQWLELMRSQVATAMQVENTPDNCDAVAPILPVLRLYEITGDADLLARTRRCADGYIDSAPRYRNCFVGFHWQTNHARAEIIFQVCPSLIYLYKVTGDTRYLDVVVDQYRRYAELLHDDATGLWFHGVSADHRTAVYWSRGVAFVFMGILMVAEHVPDTHPVRADLVVTLQRMAEVLAPLQHESGLWHKNVFNPETRLEVSGTAWFAANLERGMRLGILDASYAACADRAWHGIKGRIFQGRTPGIVGATTVSPDPAYYLNLPMNPVGNWSHFAFRFACERRRSGKGNWA